MRLPIKDHKPKKLVLVDKESKTSGNGLFSFFSNLLKNQNIKSVIIVTGFLLLSKILGFLRGVLIYQKDEITSDIIIAASKIPEIITIVLVMGTILSSLLPVASRIKEKYDDKQMVSYLNMMLIPLILVVLGISAIFFTFTEPILKTFTSQSFWSELESRDLIFDFVWTTKILLLGPVFFALQALFGVFLSIKKRFFVYSLAGIVANVGTIGGILLSGEQGYFTMAWGMTIGAGGAALLYWITSLYFGFSHKSLINIRGLYKKFKPDFWSTWKRFIPRMFLISGMIASGVLINMVADGMSGQITAFEIAISIQSIFFVLITSVGTVLFPNLSELWNKHKDKNVGVFWDRFRVYVTNVALITILGAVVTFFAADVVMWLFERLGQGQDSRKYIVYLSRLLTMSLLFQALSEIISKYFYIRERIWQPVTISLTSLVLQVVTTFLLANSGYDAGFAVGVGLFVNVFVNVLISFIFIKADYNKPKIVNKMILWDKNPTQT